MQVTQRLGSRYLLHDQIGQGGMGVVWRGQDVRSGNWLAIKVLRAEFAANPVLVARFVGERNALVRFRHPNVVTLHDMIVEGDQLALVMDLVVGGDLDTFRQHHGGTLAPGIAAGLTAQICAGLAAAHEAGIIHRDLKPANILLDNGRVKLADFGIARVTGEARSTNAGLVMGTALYLAPELIAGDEATGATDMYAVGITLYELLAGRPPFTGHVAAVMQAHLRNEPDRPASMPDRLWELITACLGKEPAARPTASELAGALDQAAKDTGDLPAAIPLPSAGSPLSPAPISLASFSPASFSPATFSPAPVPPPPTAPGRVTAPPTGPGRGVAGLAALAIVATGIAAAAAYHYGLAARTVANPGSPPTAATGPSIALDRGPAHPGRPTPGSASSGQQTGANASGTHSPGAHPGTSPSPHHGTGSKRATHPKSSSSPRPTHPSASPTAPASSPPPAVAWTCGADGPAPFADGKATGQTIQACIREDNGQLELQGTLTGVDTTAKEQVALVLKDTSGVSSGTSTSAVCTTATCTFTISLTPAAGSWTVVPQWLENGVYESSGAAPGFVAYSQAG